jgi:nitrile hydratase
MSQDQDDHQHHHEHDDVDHHGNQQHGSQHEHGSDLSEMQLRVRALETILTQKSYVDPAALDLIIEAYETRIGPHNGARAVAKAWAEPDFKRALLEDATAAVGSLGFAARVGDHLVGLPPTWYKSAPYRSRAVIDPRGVLADFGVTLPAATEIRVWDSTAETRFMVLPLRPPGTEGWSEERLARLVTRDSMIGTGLAKSAGEVAS